MFDAGIASIKERADRLMPGAVYRGEFLAKPKHNTLAYGRCPEGHIVLFDVEYGPGDHAGAHDRLWIEANAIGLEAVPVIFNGHVESADRIRGFLDRMSFLGGPDV